MVKLTNVAVKHLHPPTPADSLFAAHRHHLDSNARGCIGARFIPLKCTRSVVLSTKVQTSMKSTVHFPFKNLECFATDKDYGIDAPLLSTALCALIMYGPTLIGKNTRRK